MTEPQRNLPFENLPVCAADFIKLVIRKMRYRKKVRQQVQAELAAHFEDGLRKCKGEQEREEKAQQLIAEFGDVKLLAVLLRRAKKRCRPFWRKFLVRSCQVIGVIVLYVIVRVIFLTTGTANINVNYVDWLNNLVKTNRPDKENAKVYYDRAAELTSKIPSEIENKYSGCAGVCSTKGRSLTDFNDYEMKQLVQWLADNQMAFKALRQGAQQPSYWPVYSGGKFESMQNTFAMQNILVSNATKKLSKYRRLVRAMSWQVAYNARECNVGAALGDCMVLQKFGVHLQGKGLLTEQMTGVTIEALAHSRIFMVLQSADVPVGMLNSFCKELENQFSNQEAVVDLEAEKAFWYDLTQRGFTDDGNGGGRALKEGVPFVVKDAKSSLAGFFFWNFPDRRQFTATIDRYFTEAGRLCRKTPYQLHNEDGEANKWDEIGKECLALKILGPAQGRVGELIWRVKTGRSALLTVLAVLRYQKENAKYPADLEELVKNGYLKELPMDPYADKPLVYRKTEEGFLLYSVGADFDDDGGVASKWGQTEQGGDQVFWPVRKSKPTR